MGAAAAEEKAHRVRGRSAMESLGGLHLLHARWI
jgi:hypothetical protein